MLLSLFLGGTLAAQADTLTVSRFQYAGPFEVSSPYQIDSTDVMAKTFSKKSMLDYAVSTESLKNGKWIDLANIPVQTSEYAVNLASFAMENTRYGKVKFIVDGVAFYHVFVDGQKVDKDAIALDPATHNVVIKYLTSSSKKEVPVVSVESTEKDLFKFREDGKSFLTLKHMLHGKRIAGTSISPNGKYLLVN